MRARVTRIILFFSRRFINVNNNGAQLTAADYLARWGWRGLVAGWQ